jgi:hypothetical protein
MPKEGKRKVRGVARNTAELEGGICSDTGDVKAKGNLVGMESIESIFTVRQLF